MMLCLAISLVMSTYRPVYPDMGAKEICKTVIHHEDPLVGAACDYILDPYLEDGSNDDITCDYSGNE